MTDELLVEEGENEVTRSPSFLRTVLVGSQGIRVGWRLLAFLLGTVGAIVLIQAVLRRIPITAAFFQQAGQGILSPGLEFLVEIPSAICLLLGAWIMGRIEKRRLGDYGLSLQRGARREFLWGTVWGLCTFTAVIGIIWALHGYSPGNLALHGLTLAKYAVLWAIAFCLVGFVEEFLFRGYVQFTLSQAIGFWPAALIWSTAFGVIHLTNPGESLAGAAEVFLFAIFACLTLRRTGALWFAIGFHAAGDYAETFLFSVRDSGFAASGSLLNSSFHGPKWLTGGNVGPEASVVSLVVLGLAITLFHFLHRHQDSVHGQAAASPSSTSARWRG